MIKSLIKLIGLFPYHKSYCVCDFRSDKTDFNEMTRQSLADNDNLGF